MKQNLKQQSKKQGKGTSPWIKYCAIGGIVLVIIAVFLFVFRYMSLDREFHHNIKTFGEETYEEIFSLQDTKSRAEPIMDLAEEAFSFVGTEAAAGEQFGLLSRYSCTDPKAVSEDHNLDYIISRIGEKEGYVWVAYYQSFLDPVGEAVSASGSEKARILSRWTVQQRSDGSWTVTEIQEGP